MKHCLSLAEGSRLKEATVQLWQAWPSLTFCHLSGCCSAIIAGSDAAPQQLIRYQSKDTAGCFKCAWGCGGLMTCSHQLLWTLSLQQLHSTVTAPLTVLTPRAVRSRLRGRQPGAVGL